MLHAEVLFFDEVALAEEVEKAGCKQGKTGWLLLVGYVMRCDEFAARWGDAHSAMVMVVVERITGTGLSKIRGQSDHIGGGCVVCNVIYAGAHRSCMQIQAPLQGQGLTASHPVGSYILLRLRSVHEFRDLRPRVALLHRVPC